MVSVRRRLSLFATDTMVMVKHHGQSSRPNTLMQRLRLYINYGHYSNVTKMYSNPLIKHNFSSGDIRGFAKFAKNWAFIALFITESATESATKKLYFFELQWLLYHPL